MTEQLDLEDMHRHRGRAAVSCFLLLITFLFCLISVMILYYNAKTIYSSVDHIADVGSMSHVVYSNNMVCVSTSCLHSSSSFVDPRYIPPARWRRMMSGGEL